MPFFFPLLFSTKLSDFTLPHDHRTLLFQQRTKLREICCISSTLLRPHILTFIFFLVSRAVANLGEMTAWK